MNCVLNVVLGGLGGQGVVTASDILADAAFEAGFDVKKSDLHGMAQRGGSVSSDVRFGDRIHSPMIPAGEADYLVVFDESRIGDFGHRLKDAGTIISPSWLGSFKLENTKLLNVALLALVADRLGLAPKHFEVALRRRLKPTHYEASLRTFEQVLTASHSTISKPQLQSHELLQ